MLSFLSVAGETVTEKVIEKSRFITRSAPVDGEEQARAYLSEIKRAYPDATHRCFACVADDAGNFLRFSDDGEPQGTAGMPILDVITKNGLRKTIVVVIRYFGGIKLGAGGLVRAYSGCAAENLAQAKKVVYRPCRELLVTVAYAQAEAASRFFAESDCVVLDCSYADGVSFTVAVAEEGENPFLSSLTDRMNGRLAVALKEVKLFPFPQ